MDVSTARWLSELDMEEPTFIEHFEMEYPNDFNFQFFSSKNYSSSQAFEHKPTVAEVVTYTTGMERLKNKRWKSCTTTKQHVTPKTSSSSSQVISFGNSNSPPGDGNSHQSLHGYMDCCTVKPKDEDISQSSYHEHNQKHSLNSGQMTDIQRQDHVLAERMRREKLSERFIALSSLLPGLKKADKASILGEAAKYLKQLEERLKTLEEQSAKKIEESVVFVKKSRLSFESDHENSSSDENFECMTNIQPFPEIEARVSDKCVLIRIHCEKHKGYLANILSEIEKLHLTVTNSSALAFGTHAMDITVVAQMDPGYCMTVKDLVKNLKHALQKSM